MSKNTPAPVGDAATALELRCIGVAVEPSRDGGEVLRISFAHSDREASNPVRITIEATGVVPGYRVGERYAFSFPQVP